MRFGGGIQTKALQAMSQKLPVVMSSVAARGIDGVNGVHYLVADGVERTANAIARIHGNPELASTLGVNARELVMAKYLWSSVEEQLIADIEQLVSPAGK
jgi:glycosyltransferase involved in cell wall biosynthesis